jgi:hypothetical protein
MKVMTREGHERPSKHREATDASGSSWAPTAQTKKLAKRPRPSSLHEDSTPEDSPTHAATPTTPDEYVALKMRSPDVHTNREVVNYNKFESSMIVELRQIPCYTKTKEKGTDECFWTFFHQDWYDTVLYRKTKPICPHALGLL